jgi:hypothetical protein
VWTRFTQIDIAWSASICAKPFLPALSEFFIGMFGGVELPRIDFRGRRVNLCQSLWCEQVIEIRSFNRHAGVREVVDQDVRDVRIHAGVAVLLRPTLHLLEYLLVDLDLRRLRVHVLDRSQRCAFAVSLSRRKCVD